VTQLAPSQDHGVEQLLYLWIPGLSLGQDFTDEVDWPLERECMPLLLSLDDDSKRCSFSEGGTRMGALESSALSLLRAS
jgi:hypothetical protein